MISTLLLDMEGVQLLSDEAEHGKERAKLLLNKGFDVSSNVFSRTFFEGYKEYSLGEFKNDSKFYKKLFNDLKIPFSNDLMDELHSVYLNSFIPYPQTNDVLQVLSEKYEVYVLSNFVGSWADHIFEKFDLKKYYTGIIISSDLGCRKPEPQIYLKAVEIAKATPEECLFFDDRINNIKGAQDAGLNAILIDRNIGLRLSDVQPV